MQRLLSKRVDALALSLRFDRQSFVQLGRDTQVELAGKIAPWFKALLFTHVKEDLERLFEFGPKFLRVLAVKISAAIQTKNFTSKEIELFEGEKNIMAIGARTELLKDVQLDGSYRVQDKQNYWTLGVKWQF